MEPTAKFRLRTFKCDLNTSLANVPWDTARVGNAINKANEMIDIANEAGDAGIAPFYTLGDFAKLSWPTLKRDYGFTDHVIKKIDYVLQKTGNPLQKSET